MTVRMRGLFAAGAMLTALGTTGASHAAVTISTAATQNMICSGGVCTPTASDAVLNVGDLQTMLATSNVKLAAAGEPVDVDVNASLSWVSTNALTLDSNHSINVNQPVAVTGGGGLTLITNDGGTGGVFDFAPGASAAIWSLSSNLTINGSAYTLVADIATLASDIAGNPGGYFALAGNYNAAPDGTYSASPIATNFTGTFQGLGNTISNLTVSSTAKEPHDVGLFSLSSGTIANIVLQAANIAEKGENTEVGGIVGSNTGLLFGDHFSGNILFSHNNSNAGGLVGQNAGSVSASSASAALVGGGAIGGLVGINQGVISQSFATGASIGGTGADAGGLVGNSDVGTISNSYATGSAKGKNASRVGGFLGVQQGGAVTTSYSTGKPTSSSPNSAGGFVGQLEQGATDSSCYWDTTTSKTKDPEGGVKKVAGITGLTTEQLQSGLPAGFDLTIWAENPSINNGLPYLIANPPQ